MTETTDARRVAAEQLTHVAMMQLRRMHRGRMDKPWRDPRQGQGRALALLKMKTEMTQRELTFLLGMSRQSSAELLAKLEKQGLIERTPSPDDGRVVIVKLTEAGQAVDQTPDRQLPDFPSALDALDDDEVAKLSDYLGRAIASMEAERAERIAEWRGRHEQFERLWDAGEHRHGRHGRGGHGRPGCGCG